MRDVLDCVDEHDGAHLRVTSVRMIAADCSGPGK
jgi:hypothetical protein